jgi:hypothetical protein
MNERMNEDKCVIFCVNWAGIPESLSLYVMSEKRPDVLFLYC